MVCPLCGQENADGRKFCRFCAKPLAVEPAPSQPEMSSAPPSSPLLRTPIHPAAGHAVPNPLATASLALSFLAFIVPLGIASVVMGHISRSQIAKSQGRQSGTGLAFAGLIISYLQLAVVALIGASLVSMLFGINRELDRQPYTRAALAARLKYGDPYHPSSAEIERHRQNAVDALRLLAARQNEYLAAHPAEGYACQIYSLQPAASEANELDVHLRNSKYLIKIDQCRGTGDNRYAVVAIPRSEFNSPESPVYCLNQTGIIRKYDPGRTTGVQNAILFQHDTCPQDGEIVEP